MENYMTTSEIRKHPAMKAESEEFLPPADLQPVATTPLFAAAPSVTVTAPMILPQTLAPLTDPISASPPALGSERVLPVASAIMATVPPTGASLPMLGTAAPAWKYAPSLSPTLNIPQQSWSYPNGTAASAWKYAPSLSPTLNIPQQTWSYPTLLEPASLEKGYGATPTIQPKVGQEKMTLSLPLVICCAALPLIFYSVTFYILVSSIRYSASVAAYLIVAFIFLAVVGVGAAAVMARSTSDRQWIGLMCVLSFAGSFAAVILAERSYMQLMQPYYALQQLNVYENVNPSSAQGNQFMDFGILNFVASASIDNKFNMSFKNRDVHCVAPITSGSSPDSYEFWAVGINCCSDGFQCGDWKSALAHSGLRITDETQRQWYELATRQAASKYNISVRQPVFFQWVQNPAEQIESLPGMVVYRFLRGLFLFGCVDLCFVFVSVLPFVKHWV
jgi:hypothetical protein